MSDKKTPLPVCKIVKMEDKSEDHRVHKRSVFDLPMRLLIVGRSLLSGKTNSVGSLILRPWGDDDVTGQQFYKNDFDGNDIYIICPSTLIDYKWEMMIKKKMIPSSNIYDSYDEMEMEKLYEKLVKQHQEEKPRHKLVIMDDVSWSGDFKAKMHGVMSKFFCNSRHYLVSIVVTSQKHSDLATCMRENASGFMFYASTQKQMDLIYNDVGECPKKEFMQMFRKATHEKHSFLVVNYSNDPDERFLDSNFQLIE